MDMNWFQSILYGFISGLADILPVSGQAHRLILMNLFGESAEPALLRLLVHIGTLAGLYYGCQNHIIRIIRAIKLSRIPKRRRKRPLDTQTLMDFEVVKMMLIPMILGLVFANRAAELGSKLIYVAVFLFLNGLILYIPRYLPGSNKDSRGMSRVESLLMGLGGAASVLPGISCMGTVASVATVCGAEKTYASNMALLACLPMTAGLIVTDIIALFAVGLGGLSFLTVLNYLLAGAAAFGGILLGTRLLRLIVDNIGIGVFTFYCWGASLFSFILFLNI